MSNDANGEKCPHTSGRGLFRKMLSSIFIRGKRSVTTALTCGPFGKETMTETPFSCFSYRVLPPSHCFLERSRTGPLLTLLVTPELSLLSAGKKKKKIKDHCELEGTALPLSGFQFLIKLELRLKLSWTKLRVLAENRSVSVELPDKLDLNWFFISNSSGFFSS